MMVQLMSSRSRPEVPTTAMHDCNLHVKKMQFSTNGNSLGAEAEMWQSAGQGGGLPRMQLIMRSVSNSVMAVQ